MKPGINFPRVTSGKFSLGKSIFSQAKVRSVTSTIHCKFNDKIKLNRLFFFTNGASFCWWSTRARKDNSIPLLLNAMISFDVSKLFLGYYVM